MMISTGVVRRIDPLGRIVLPKGLRDNLEISNDTMVEIFTDGDRILFEKHRPSCTFCKEKQDGMNAFQGHFVCTKCSTELQEPRASCQSE